MTDTESKSGGPATGDTNVRVREYPVHVLRFLNPEWDAYTKRQKLRLLNAADAESIVREIRTRNATTVGMHETIPELLSPEDTSSQDANHIAIGDSDPSTSSSDTSLDNEVGRFRYTNASTNGADLVVEVFIDSTELNGNTIAECGVFTGEASDSNAAMLNHADISPNVSKTSSKVVTVEVTLTWTN